MNLRKALELGALTIIGAAGISGVLLLTPQTQARTNISQPTKIIETITNKDTPNLNSTDNTNLETTNIINTPTTESEKPVQVASLETVSEPCNITRIRGETKTEFDERFEDKCISQIPTTTNTRTILPTLDLEKIIANLNEMVRIEQAKDVKERDSIPKKTRDAIVSLRDAKCGNESCLTQYDRLLREKGNDPLKGISLFMAETWDHKTGKVNPFSVSYTLALGPQIQASNIKEFCPTVSPDVIEILVKEELKSRNERKGLVEDKLQDYINARTAEVQEKYGTLVEDIISDINECAVKFYSNVVEKLRGEDSLADITSKWYKGVSMGVGGDTSPRALELIGLGRIFYTGLLEASGTSPVTNKPKPETNSNSSTQSTITETDSTTRTTHTAALQTPNNTQLEERINVQVPTESKVYDFAKLDQEFMAIGAPCPSEFEKVDIVRDSLIRGIQLGNPGTRYIKHALTACSGGNYAALEERAKKLVGVN